MKIIALLDVDNDKMREIWGNDLARFFNQLNEHFQQFSTDAERPVIVLEKLDLDRLMKFATVVGIPRGEEGTVHNPARGEH